MKIKRAVVVLGNLNEGFTIVGPFEDWESAAIWADSHGYGSGDSWIMTVKNPKDVKRRRLGID